MAAVGLSKIDTKLGLQLKWKIKKMKKIVNDSLIRSARLSHDKIN